MGKSCFIFRETIRGVTQPATACAHMQTTSMFDICVTLLLSCSSSFVRGLLPVEMCMEMRQRQKEGPTVVESSGVGSDKFIKARINFVDLAGR